MSAGVKLREGRPAGVEKHAQRAAELIANASPLAANSRIFGLCADEIRSFAFKTAGDISEQAGISRPDGKRSLEFTLQLESP